MPTVVTHAAVPLCLGLGLGTKNIPPSLLLAGVACSMVPDLDVIAFKFGIAYANAFGHRGFTHSLLFAFALPTLALLLKRWFKVGYWRIWWFLTVSLLSHSVLDSLTTGGMGVGWLWPWSQERFFAPVQVIKVAPFQLAQYLKPNGIAVIQSELLWVWLPGIVMMIGLIMLRKQPVHSPLNHQHNLSQQ
ncbi:metal-dependent hydrolase [Pragia fontium]|uniref:Inner membrane protein n=2 Tax=Pragia fontium TaxID=82985 RepID=A0AAJ5BG26_9GAMM|nr:metal-dependent hydrolase [Pragia fontium]GKX63288.1 membrane protein [Pragia fontium]SFC14486.1 inner membrane protein [Pragia fontium DSM 5563 = ATCC 49100]SUB81303.1 Inner membrane protein ybcI [Pragia fontium]VEJ53460.1 Inner membrane protein ybcI [Pragia fontium]